MGHCWWVYCLSVYDLHRCWHDTVKIFEFNLHRQCLLVPKTLVSQALEYVANMLGNGILIIISRDNVYGVVSITTSLREFIQFIWWIFNSEPSYQANGLGRESTCRASLYLPSQFNIAQPKSSDIHFTVSWRLENSVSLENKVCNGSSSLTLKPSSL